LHQRASRHVSLVGFASSAIRIPELGARGRGNRGKNSSRHARDSNPTHMRFEPATREIRTRHTRDSNPPHARFEPATREIRTRHTRDSNPSRERFKPATREIRTRVFLGSGNREQKFKSARAGFEPASSSSGQGVDALTTAPARQSTRFIGGICQQCITYT
jgi:hypothetical protein